MKTTLYIASLVCTGGLFEGKTFSSDPLATTEEACQSLQNKCCPMGISADWGNLTLSTYTLQSTTTISASKILTSQ